MQLLSTTASTWWPWRSGWLLLLMDCEGLFLSYFMCYPQIWGTWKNSKYGLDKLMAPFLHGSRAVKPQISNDVTCEISSQGAGPFRQRGPSISTLGLTPDGSALPQRQSSTGGLNSGSSLLKNWRGCLQAFPKTVSSYTEGNGSCGLAWWEVPGFWLRGDHRWHFASPASTDLFL